MAEGGRFVGRRGRYTKFETCGQACVLLLLQPQTTNLALCKVMQKLSLNCPAQQDKRPTNISLSFLFNNNRLLSMNSCQASTKKLQKNAKKCLLLLLLLLYNVCTKGGLQNKTQPACPLQKGCKGAKPLQYKNAPCVAILQGKGTQAPYYGFALHGGNGQARNSCCDRASKRVVVIEIVNMY